MIGRRNLLIGAAALAAGTMTGAALAQRDYRDPEDIYDALRTQPGVVVDVAGGQINVVFADGAPGLERRPVLRWVEMCAGALVTYFGRYPTRRHGLLVVADNGDRVSYGTTYGYRGSISRIYVGRAADEKAFADDWVLVHEMTHTALPDLPRRALWLQEGNATWIEPVARAQAGQLPISEVWRQAIAGMPKGVRRTGAGGMDGTREWGRLYWGGAIFWLEAEIEIYERSGGRFLLRDALRAVNRASGGNSVVWSPEELMAAGDHATGTSALRELYEKFSVKGIEESLPSLFRRLGAEADPTGRVLLDPRAELAELTRRITQG